ncbi:MAG: M23 family metallopeptidase [Lachnospiraceae bacterium]|nr:M23 family metallopeptidase [Lachnospiraceae bacterium]
MTWNKKKEEKTKRADTKKQTTGYTLLLIPNSSDEAKTVEITYDRLLQLLTGATATAIIVIGLIISMMVHNHKIKNSLEEAEKSISQLRATNSTLEGAVSSLNDQIEADKKVFSQIEDTISKKEEEQAQSAEEAAMPNEIPIRNAKAILIEDPYRDSQGGATAGIVFSTLKGAIVSAAAEGIVAHVDSDEENPYYTRGIVIDHGNGYMTYYRLNGDVSIEEGAVVEKGGVLAVLPDDGFVAYEIKKDGEFIDPLTVIKQEGQ